MSATRAVAVRTFAATSEGKRRTPKGCFPLNCPPNSKWHLRDTLKSV
jgi:hypothetical protein